MRLFHRKSQFERFLESVSDSLDVPDSVRSVPGGKAVKAALIAAGGLAGLTAGSAGVSSLRRKRAGSSPGS